MEDVNVPIPYIHTAHVSNPPFTIPGHFWQANSYLVGNTINDTGIDPERILPYKDRIQNIVLTHGHFEHTVLVKLLKDGDVIDGFTVYHTPGHTGGSICLFREEDGVLIAGDTIFPEGSYGRYDFPTGSLAALRDSVSRMAELSVDSLWSGHGEPVMSGAKAHVALSKRNLC